MGAVTATRPSGTAPAACREGAPAPAHAPVAAAPATSHALRVAGRGANLLAPRPPHGAVAGCGHASHVNERRQGGWKAPAGFGRTAWYSGSGETSSKDAGRRSLPCRPCSAEQGL